MKLEMLIEMPSAWTAVTGRLGVHLFQGQVTVADMDRLDAIGEKWRQRHRGKSVELVVVFPSDTRMTNEERNRMTQLIRRWEHDREASATVILASGLIGAMQRSVLTGFMLVAPPPHPSKVFGTIGEAIKWLVPYVRDVCENPPTTDVLLEAVANLCATFERREHTG